MKSWPKFSLMAAVSVVGSLVALMYVSAQNESLIQFGRAFGTRSSFIMDSYRTRNSCIDQFADRRQDNYRTIYSGRKGVYFSDGMDVKNMMETELHPLEGIKALFSYRELVHGYEGLMRGIFIGKNGFYRSNHHPPLSSQIPGNAPEMRLMGVKYVISVDETIVDPDLIYKGTCVSPEGPIGIFDRGASIEIRSAGGKVHVYEVARPLGTVFSLFKSQVRPYGEIIRSLQQKEDRPWEHGVVYLETYVNTKPLPPADHSYSVAPKTLDPQFTFQSITVRTQEVSDHFVIFSYLWLPNWEAQIDSLPTNLLRAYGGFMAVQVPAGSHVIHLKYVPRDFYFGLILTLIALLAPFLLYKIF